MKLRESVLTGTMPQLGDLTQEQLERLVWAFRGVVKEQERDRAFWGATNANLRTAYERLTEKERELALAYETIHQDLAVANQLQESLLPVPSDRMASDLEISVFHRQLADVGGDYYDFFTTRSDGYAVGVFDISGHGVSAALVMTYLKARFMTVMEDRSSPAQIVQSVNDGSLAFMRTVKKYAAVNFVEFGPSIIRYVNGGGNGLLVSDESVEAFTKRDQFLGLRAQPFHEYELPFRSGDLLALYTDGMVEAQDDEGRDYTRGRLNSLIIRNRNHPVEAVLRQCVRDYLGFRVHDSDDVTLMLIRKRTGNGN